MQKLVEATLESGLLFIANQPEVLCFQLPRSKKNPTYKRIAPSLELSLTLPSGEDGTDNRARARLGKGSGRRWLHFVAIVVL